jgi:tripartite-type tricarboxylate transporter receptor subunit TctC
VEFVVPYKPGGGYDVTARQLLPFLERHLGATVIVKNEPGAGAKVALNRLAKENDGLSLITFGTRNAVISQSFGEDGVKYDLGKFNWLGTLGKEEYLLAVGKKSGYKSITDLQQAKEVKFGAGSMTTSKAIWALVMGSTLSVNVKMVAGYKGTADETLALLRGEIDALIMNPQSLLPYADSQDVLPLLTMMRERSKIFPHIPTIFEVKKMSAQHQRMLDISIAFDTVGRPVATTPGVPKERVAFLEEALKKAVEDPDLQKRLETIGFSIEYATGKETAEAVNTTLLKGEDRAMYGKLLGIGGY